MSSVPKNVQAGDKPNPTACLSMFSVGGGALPALSLSWYHKIRQAPSWAVAKSLDSGVSLSGFRPQSCYFLALSPWECY